MSQSSFPVESPYTPMTPSSAPEIPRLTVSPSETTLKFEDVVPDIKIETPKPSEKKPVKKRKSWGQELPTPKTNLPPRKRAKTEDEKEQRRIERVLRNRAAAQISRERKRLEIEKLEGEKLKIEQQNEYLLRRLAQMEEENNRLNRQVAKLSSEIHSSRGTSPQSITGIPSPTLTPILFKQEQDDLSLDKIAYPSPSSADLYSPTLSTLDLQESSDMTQHPAAVLCDLQCQSENSTVRPSLLPSNFLTPHQTFVLLLQAITHHLFQTMTFAAYSTVILPLSQIFLSLKEGSPLTFSPEEISRHLPLILWLISTPNLSNSKISGRRSVFRIQLLTRLLACSPAMARPLRDATSRELQLAVSELQQSGSSRSSSQDFDSYQHWELLITMIWAIDRVGNPSTHVVVNPRKDFLLTRSRLVGGGISRLNSRTKYSSLSNRLRSSRCRRSLS